MDIKIEEDEKYFHLTIPKNGLSRGDIEAAVGSLKGEGKKEDPANGQGAVDQISTEIRELTHELQDLWPDSVPFEKKPWKDMNVLVVDDHSTMRTIVTKILMDLRFSSSKIEEAVDGRMALNKLKSNKFDLIISDWHMPNMTGIDLLRVIRSVPGLKGTPFLMATAEGQKENILEAVQVGVNNYIVKPFKAAQMEQKLKTILSKSMN